MNLAELQLIDRICGEFKNALVSGTRPRIGELMLQVPIPLRDSLCQKLVRLEVDFRQSQGDSIVPEEYSSFGDHIRELVRHLLRYAEGQSSTGKLSANDPTRSLVHRQDGQSTAPVHPHFIGRYRIDRVLGKGGFGTVYLASDDLLHRAVAIKVPHGSELSLPANRDAHLAEAQNAARLDHPNIVPVYDVGHNDQLPLFIVSKYVEGTDLATKLRDSSFSFVQSAELIAAIADALHYAHEQGLVHRDVKPGNILLDRNGTPFLVDFGLALREQDIGKGATFAGTPAYMSPEQARGEGHRVDARSDIYSLGVVLYRMLTGQTTFQNADLLELLKLVANKVVQPPRQIKERIPDELERVCLKALELRAQDRYPTAKEFADDLRCFIDHSAASEGIAGQSTGGNTKRSSSSQLIVPKGLRSFDERDASFFLRLVPGPRDRHGIPESIRFWKSRIEQEASGKTFSVGLMYGPSGCGKSSLVKAGLLPRLSQTVFPVFVEANGDDTETRIRDALRRRLPFIDEGSSLLDAITHLRRDKTLLGDRKVLIVIDQFEQWLHGNVLVQNTELVRALRQCDGDSVQCLLMVRDDFWLAVSRFLQELEIRLLEGENCILVDLFELEHSRNVLLEFGRAFGKLDTDGTHLSSRHLEFIEQAVNGLAEEGKVICVRLALFAEMMKTKEWVPGELKKVGGTTGLARTFLEESFSTKSAPVRNRYHQDAARAVLTALLPEAGTNIKGRMKSYDELKTTAGYHEQEERFRELIQILESELRLIASTNPDHESDSSREKYYQLTHDYLIPPLRSWLTEKQRETARGRAAFLLKERATSWNFSPENRHLPTSPEWIRILALTSRKKWSSNERKMMARASRVRLTFWATVAAVLLLTVISVQQTVAYFQRDRDRTAKLHTADNLRLAVDGLQGGSGTAIPFLLDRLEPFPAEQVLQELKTRFESKQGWEQRNIAYGLARYGQADVDLLVGHLTSHDADPMEVDNIVAALNQDHDRALAKLRARGELATHDEQWEVKTRIAIVAMHLGDLSIAEDMLQTEPGELTDTEAELMRLRMGNDLVIQAYNSRTDEEREIDRKLGRHNELWAELASYADALFYSGRVSEALLHYRRLSAENPRMPRAWQGVAMCQAKLGQPEAARQTVQQMEALFTGGVPPETTETAVLVEALLGNPEEAFELLREFVRETKNDPPMDQGEGTRLDLRSSYLRSAAYTASELYGITRETSHPLADEIKAFALDLLQTSIENLPNGNPYLLITNRQLYPLHDDVRFVELAAPLLLQTWDPIQRTEFITAFHRWSGNYGALAESLDEIHSPSIQSGVCLALGGITEPSSKAKLHWKGLVESWYQNSSHSGTHSAAYWLSQQWNFPLTSSESVASQEGLDWWHSHGLRFVRIEAGITRDYYTGHTEVKQDFWMSDCEITESQYCQFLYDREYSGPKPEHPNTPLWYMDRTELKWPVSRISWVHAIMYCNWLSNELGLSPCYEIEPFGDLKDRFTVKQISDAGVRLPTITEWNHACQTGATTYYFFGSLASFINEYAWTAANSDNQVHVVAQKRCNDWGLFDMCGNVSEWCWDEVPSQIQSEFTRRAILGGSYQSDPYRTRGTDSGPETFLHEQSGFRVVISISE